MDERIDQTIRSVLVSHPFLSYGEMKDVQYLGIVQNSDAQLLSMYLLTLIPSDHLRKEFLRLGSEWWWQSNRQIPINIFLNFQIFRPFLRHFSAKDFELLAGPSVSLQETIARRVRKRQITLIRKMPGV